MELLQINQRVGKNANPTSDKGMSWKAFLKPGWDDYDYEGLILCWPLMSGRTLYHTSNHYTHALVTACIKYIWKLPDVIPWCNEQLESSQDI